jgi:acetyl esterase/lipase
MPDVRARRSTALLVAAAALVLTACGGNTASPSASSTPDVKVERSVDYRTVDGTDLQLDACLPTRGDTARPAVVLVHGGAFQEGDRSNMTGVCKDFAEHGWAAFAVDYRLLPASFPAQTEDVSAAVGWLRDPAQVERFGVDPDRIALLGSSAGGIIALSTAESLGASGTPVTAVVGLSAAGDLTAAALEEGDPDPALQKIVLAYLGCTAVETCDTAKAASPLFGVATLPPTLLVHGSDELIPLAQAKALHAAIQAAGIPSELQVEDGSHHGLQLLTPEVAASVFDFLDANSSP